MMGLQSSTCAAVVHSGVPLSCEVVDNHVNQ